MKEEEAEQQQDSEPKQPKILRDQQTIFGGLPLAETIKFPIIKSLQFQKKEVKKFSLNEFLDHYLQNEAVDQNEEDSQQRQ